ncbi:MAG: CDF family Co(II)/Ni(II) efflux transporter DmeF [Syntrophales bacterium]|jgi:cation diffusion facilitator family transporter|nr:CDF family Co(II)/Ni(II) efflux transporter DmeF [Syntrophales bacterium]
MRTHDIESWRHRHDFSAVDVHGERKTARVAVLTAVTMVAEVIAGLMFRSMALLADGWHMATHVAAFGITLFAYRYARAQADNPQFTFGTGKVSVLAGFASAIALAAVALFMIMESAARLFEPQSIRFNEAMIVAVVGLLVNLVSGLILRNGGHDHGHEHGQACEVNPGGHSMEGDHNLRAAYLHVLADALTSVLAIVALAAGKYLGWVWMDPLMGVAGAAVIARWSYGLVRDTSRILLDSSADEETQAAIKSAIEQDADSRVADLHVWHVGPYHLSAAVSVVADNPQTPEAYKQMLCGVPQLTHVTVEVNQCHSAACAIQEAAPSATKEHI